MFCKHIWITHKILSILSVHTCGKNEILPPTKCGKKNRRRLWRQVGAKCGSELLNVFDLLRVWGVWGVGVGRSEPEDPCGPGKQGYATMVAIPVWEP